MRIRARVLATGRGSLVVLLNTDIDQRGSGPSTLFAGAQSVNSVISDVARPMRATS
ncbi:hypothetical protein GA0115254_103858 [Streptomyces sp. Ncost-T10-10d]|nr:hypothetical protein GA0115254_103858 [Streptomyces sp. Ncost-T10-10d]